MPEPDYFNLGFGCAIAMYDMRLGASSNTFFYWCTDLSVFGRYSRRNMSSLATAFAPFAGWVYRTFPITKHSVFVSLISYAFSAAYLVGGCGSFRSRLWRAMLPVQITSATVEALSGLSPEFLLEGSLTANHQVLLSGQPGTVLSEVPVEIENRPLVVQKGRTVKLLLGVKDGQRLISHRSLSTEWSGCPRVIVHKAESFGSIFKSHYGVERPNQGTRRGPPPSKLGGGAGVNPPPAYLRRRCGQLHRGPGEWCILRPRRSRKEPERVAGEMLIRRRTRTPHHPISSKATSKRRERELTGMPQGDPRRREQAHVWG
ncbi:hypothetical protein B0H13DRAFT_1859661 [Mycena leptocephala]|nr:hypothetical protein B0H13DRAFT_1859661 [Mycena leptocephala]